MSEAAMKVAPNRVAPRFIYAVIAALLALVALVGLDSRDNEDHSLYISITSATHSASPIG
jgi:hypothetical protein